MPSSKPATSCNSQRSLENSRIWKNWGVCVLFVSNTPDAHVRLPPNRRSRWGHGHKPGQDCITRKCGTTVTTQHHWATMHQLNLAIRVQQKQVTSNCIYIICFFWNTKCQTKREVTTLSLEGRQGWPLVRPWISAQLEKTLLPAKGQWINECYWPHYQSMLAESTLNPYLDRDLKRLWLDSCLLFQLVECKHLPAKPPHRSPFAASALSNVKKHHVDRSFLRRLFRFFKSRKPNKIDQIQFACSWQYCIVRLRQEMLMMLEPLTKWWLSYIKHY